jgi:hypothetical protein
MNGRLDGEHYASHGDYFLPPGDSSIADDVQVERILVAPGDHGGWSGVLRRMLPRPLADIADRVLGPDAELPETQANISSLVAWHPFGRYLAVAQRYEVFLLELNDYTYDCAHAAFVFGLYLLRVSHSNPIAGGRRVCHTSSRSTCIAWRGPLRAPLRSL